MQARTAGQSGEGLLYVEVECPPELERQFPARNRLVDGQRNARMGRVADRGQALWSENTVTHFWRRSLFDPAQGERKNNRSC